MVKRRAEEGIKLDEDESFNNVHETIDQRQMTNKRLNPKNLANQDRKGFNPMKMIHVKIFEDIVQIQMLIMPTKVS